MSVEVDNNQEELDLAGQNATDEGGENQSTPEDGALLEGQDEGDEVEISIGGAEPPADEVQKAPEWVRELRRTNRELQKEKKELEARLNAREAENKPAFDALGEIPCIEDDDIAFDTDKHNAAVKKMGRKESPNRPRSNQGQSSAESPRRRMARTPE